MNKRLLKIIVGGSIFFASIIIFEALNVNIFWLELLIYLSAYLVIGYDVLLKAIKNIFRGKIFDENFLMMIATIGAFCIHAFPEAVAVMLFYQIGELFQSFAVSKSRASIAKLMDIRPDYANVLVNGKTIRKSPEDVNINDQIIICAGEKIPLDGKILQGNSTLNTSALTGESLPREVKVGDDVISGCINLNGVIIVKVTKKFAESTVSKILDLVENASSKKSNSENFISKFAKYYTPIVVIVAVLLAVLPPLLFPNQTFADWIYRGLTFLVVSCPCALVVSIPMSFFGGLGGASRCGILIKGSNYLEALSKVDTVVFDKTGTLTHGSFTVQSIYSIGITREELLEKATYAEAYTSHPISISLREAYQKPIDKNRISEVKELAGFGVSAKVDNKEVVVGNSKLMQRLGQKPFEISKVGTVVHIAIDNVYAGYILITDKIKQDSYTAMQKLKAVGIKQTIMLTGDLEKVGKDVAKELGIDKVYAELLPQDKVAKIEELINSGESKKVAFVGDGINDAPVLARADIGISMGGLGTDAAIEASDVVIMNDEISKIATAKKIAKNTVKIAYENTVFAIVIKVATLLLSAVGIVNMWLAVFADVGVSVLAILNSFRALTKKE